MNANSGQDVAAGVGCFIFFYLLLFLAFWGTVGYIVLHFVTKAW